MSLVVMIVHEYSRMGSAPPLVNLASLERCAKWFLRSVRAVIRLPNNVFADIVMNAIPSDNSN